MNSRGQSNTDNIEFFDLNIDTSSEDELNNETIIPIDDEKPLLAEDQVKAHPVIAQIFSLLDMKGNLIKNPLLVNFKDELDIKDFAHLSEVSRDFYRLVYKNIWNVKGLTIGENLAAKLNQKLRWTEGWEQINGHDKTSKSMLELHQTLNEIDQSFSIQTWVHNHPDRTIFILKILPFLIGSVIPVIYGLSIDDSLSKDLIWLPILIGVINCLSLSLTIYTDHNKSDTNSKIHFFSSTTTNLSSPSSFACNSILSMTTIERWIKWSQAQKSSWMHHDPFDTTNYLACIAVPMALIGLIGSTYALASVCNSSNFLSVERYAHDKQLKSATNKAKLNFFKPRPSTQVDATHTQGNKPSCLSFLGKL